MPTPLPPADAWRRALAGDRDAFEEALAPFQDDLHTAAERLLEVERDPVDGRPTDEAPADLTREELVGETLLRAWDLRERFDGDRMSFRAWLLGLQSRSLDRFVRREARYAQRKAVSLDEELPTNEDADAVQEQFYEFRQPFDVDTYEEIIAGAAPDDLDPSDVDLDEADLTETEGRRAAVLHDEFELSLPEVAQIVDASLRDTAALMNLAREGLRPRLGSPDDDDHDDDPRTDSYTGDPLPDA